MKIYKYLYIHTFIFIFTYLYIHIYIFIFILHIFTPWTSSSLIWYSIMHHNLSQLFIPYKHLFCLILIELITVISAQIVTTLAPSISRNTCTSWARTACTQKTKLWDFALTYLIPTTQVSYTPSFLPCFRSFFLLCFLLCFLLRFLSPSLFLNFLLLLPHYSSSFSSLSLFRLFVAYLSFFSRSNFPPVPLPFSSSSRWKQISPSSLSYPLPLLSLFHIT